MTIYLPSDEPSRRRQRENAIYVINEPLPDRFEWNGKKEEPEWFQSWVRAKAERIKAIAARVGYLPDMVFYWSKEKLDEVYSEGAIAEFLARHPVPEDF